MMKKRLDVYKRQDEESTLLTEAKSYEQAADQLLAMGPKLVLSLIHI